MPHTGRKPPSLRTSLIGVPLAVAASLLVLELLVRLMHIAPPLENRYDYFVSDPALPFKPRPNSELQGGSIGDEFSFSHRHNSLGLRDVEHETDKPPEVFRILILGDSFTYGIGAAFEDTYPSRLERLLNERPGREARVEIIKAGIPRYFPEAERLLLEHYGLHFKPDLVLVAFVPNDLAETHLGLDAVSADPAHGFLVTKEARMLGRAGIIFYKYWHTFRVLWVHGVSDRLWFDPHMNPERVVGREGSALKKAWRKVKNEYRAMIDLARKHSANIAFVYIPPKGPPWGEETERELERWCNAESVPLISTLAVLREASKHQKLYWDKDMHCNAAGYDVIAEHLANRLAALGLVP